MSVFRKGNWESKICSKCGWCNLRSWGSRLSKREKGCWVLASPSRLPVVWRGEQVAQSWHQAQSAALSPSPWWTVSSQNISWNKAFLKVVLVGYLIPATRRLTQRLSLWMTDGTQSHEEGQWWTLLFFRDPFTDTETNVWPNSWDPHGLLKLTHNINYHNKMVDLGQLRIWACGSEYSYSASCLLNMGLWASHSFYQYLTSSFLQWRGQWYPAHRRRIVINSRKILVESWTQNHCL